MIGWCTECKTVAIEPIEDGYDVECFDCRYPLVPRPETQYFAREKDGVLRTEEVSAEEYQRIISGQGSTPKQSTYAMANIFKWLDEAWGGRYLRPEYNTVDLTELWRERKRQTFARTAQLLLGVNG